MAKTIAVAGKGGVGKTSIAALLISQLSQRGLALAIDADPSANLNQALGLELGETIGDIRENLDREIKQGTFSAGMTKQEFLDLKLQEALVESDRMDLLVMGRPEGPGCYCAVNNMLRAIIDRIGDRYDFVVIDTEAGMEHISRQTTRDVDLLLIVSDPTMRGLNAAAVIRGLISRLRTTVGQSALVINRVSRGLPDSVWSFTKDNGLEPAFIIAEDEGLYDLEINGRPLVELPQAAALREGVARVVSALGI